MKTILLYLITLCSFTSCCNYYKAITATQPTSSGNIEDLEMKKKYFVLREENNAFAINNISFSADKKEMYCNLDSLPFEHTLHLKKGRNGKMRYRVQKSTNEDESVVLNEVHLYINSGANIGIGPVTIPLDRINKIEIIEKDKARTTRSYVIGTTIGITIAVGTIVAVGASVYYSNFSVL